VLLVNIFFQFRTLDTIAEGLRLALERGYLPANCKVIARLRGEKEQEARAILAGADCIQTGAFAEACALAVDFAKAPARPQPRMAAST
jgi:succinyl-CoA synthetase beta subunit